MIDDISDYKYVNGDLSTIIINGEIMPKRSESDKKILRGEDITFCLEVLRRRCTYPCTKGKCVAGGNEKWSFDYGSTIYSQSTFENIISNRRYWDIVKLALNDGAFNPQYYAYPSKVAFCSFYVTNFLTDLPTETQFHQETTGSYESEERFFLNETFSFLNTEHQTSKHDDFATGKPLKQANVQKVFDDIEKLDKVEIQLPSSRISFWNSELTLTNLVKWYQPTESGWEPSWPTEPSYIGYFMRGYHHKNTYTDYYYSYYGETPDIEVEIDTDVIDSDAKLWSIMWVGTQFYDVGGITTTKSFRILKMVDDSPQSSSGKLKFKYKIDKSMIDSIAGDVGVELKSPYVPTPAGEDRSATVQQTFDIDIMGFFVTGSINNTTKWQ